MTHTTDQNGPGLDDPTPADLAVGQVLAAMAAHFRKVRPDAFLTPDAVPVCMSAEVDAVGGREVSSRRTVLAHAVTEALPPSPPRCTRTQYADLLLKQAAAHGWREGRCDQ